MTRRSSLGELERQLMEVLWAAEPGARLSSRQVQERMDPAQERAYTTIKTVLDRLVEKGVVQRHRDGRVWRYRARASRQSLTAESLRSVLGDIESSDRSTALLHFLEGVEATDRAELRRLLDQVEATNRPA
ncbi:putative transcriptional regulator [Branchiibius hedensis]|uniref:Predicted transcriptional regulator n=1 Tax=Branchiibius hedensis TaxID=672460 RepID=A0A2Y9C2H5_9MICO|nr:BlaI/MecI/CopY family transcriptional regulator [Branchiibius hedensis]PWJ27282.1 putative transcriptional regulator [Branchiibius hedensis]SSA36093.1 Predicted transcriptional regulator [Branchiibius hedensis]